MMTELCGYSCSHPSFHLERFVVLLFEYHSEPNVNLPSLFYLSAVHFTSLGRHSLSQCRGKLLGVLRGLRCCPPADR